jgi:tol-pal system protein YbgF
MHMKSFIAGLLLILASGPAYAQNKDMLQLQRDMIYLQQAVKQLQTTVDQNNAVVKGLVERMADQVNTLAGGMQKITQTVDGIKTQNDATTREMRTILTNLNSAVSELQEGVSSMRAQVNSVSRELTTLKTTAEPLAGPSELWRTAYLDYFAGNYDLAISGFQEFISKFSSDPRAPEAHLLLGDALSAQKKYEPALAEYDFVLQKYPESDKTRAALLKKGLALAVANQPQQAIATLTEVVKKFPNTSEANSANTKLRELQAGQRRTPAPAR